MGCESVSVFNQDIKSLINFEIVAWIVRISFSARALVLLPLEDCVSI